MSAAPDAGWASRRLHFIGIGGAGMSGLALVCHGLGATVSGSDWADSSYMERLRRAGFEPAVGHDAANLPTEAEVVISTAIGEENPELALAREQGAVVLHRGALLAELCAEKRLIAVAGTHGKTTTSAMLVWALRAIGADPAFFIGGEVPGLGAEGESTNAGWGEGEWVVAEADESDASFLRLRPEIAVITNVEMDHHTRWGSLAELRLAFRGFLAPAEGVAMPADGSLSDLLDDKRVLGFNASVPGPAELALSIPGAHNLLNARAVLATIELAGLDAEVSAVALADFPGVRRRLELKGKRDGARIYDDYAHHPTEVRATLSALRELGPQRLIAVFQPHLYSRTKALSEEFGAALALADEVAVLDVYPAREEPLGELAGVSGLAVARAAAERMGEAGLVAAHRRAGAGGPGPAPGPGPGPGHDRRRRCLQAGRGPSRGCRCGVSAPPPGVQPNFSLARLTTVRTGGRADWFARPGSEQELLELLAWAGEGGLAVGTIGSGSNLLVADDGFRGLAIKLDGDLATIKRDGERILCGGGARLPSASAKAAAWGLSGLEFGINIPGSAGGAVRMNANAYGGQLAEVLEWVDIASPSGLHRRSPEQLGFAYRNSNLGAEEVVSRASFRLRPGDPAAIKASMAGMRERRRDAQPSGIKTFGSTFKNPEDERAEGRSAGALLEAAGCRGLRHGGARFSEKHANFVENCGEATTSDVLELMAEGRRRVNERFGVELEPEVQVLGEVRWPGGWEL